ncbi:hypothetical protein ASE04_20600 [Rhizobium sp. Root708]|uniref:hypothetical protein n=1 Tax=Rhizobium sp. Root708 TaxID=1736592 RepID=UPI0006F3353C|nr:hypothetical protein [Rhizobium sp. Root708]KRB61910.1 hypothetical protein ASE04_20600 [Rhizobium sp. Root708]
MLIGFGLAADSSLCPHYPHPTPIAAFGDSLTEGAGASAPSHSFPALAANLFHPPRTLINRGIGGQTSTQIAARQGGRELLIAIKESNPKNLFPRTRDWMQSFETGIVNGLTHELVDVGSDDAGLPYGDVRIYGTANAGFTDFGRQIYGAIATNHAAASGSAWTVSGDIQKIGGALAGISSLRLALVQADDLGGYLNEIATVAFELDGARHSASATGVAVHPYIRSTHLLDVIPGNAVDITLRVFPGQFEAGSAVTELVLTPGTGEIPAYRPEAVLIHRFDETVAGWSSRNQDGHAAPLTVQAGKLIAANDDGGALRGCELEIAPVPQGKTIRVAFDLEFLSGAGQIQIGGLQAAGGSWATTTREGDPTWPISTAGHHELVFTSGNAAFGNTNCTAIAFLASGSLLSWSLDNVLVSSGDDDPQVEIAHASIDALNGTSSIVGTILEASGVITKGSNGQLYFTRTGEGEAIAVAYGSAFTPDDAMALRRDVQWIWAGRNNAADRQVVLSDIAAMALAVAGNRCLVGSVLPSAADGPDIRQAIADLNADLAVRYGARYVDLHAALVAAANATTGDQADIATGLVPRSLRSDGLHLNDVGYAVVAAAWADATLAMRW